MYGLEKYVRSSGLEPSLLELVRVRESQINAWQEVTFYTDRERATLAWIEAVTEVFDEHVPDDIYELAQTHFIDKEKLQRKMKM